MKQFTILLALFLLPGMSPAQELPPAKQVSRDNYIQKSKNQASGGLIALGAGVLTGTIGYLLMPKDGQGGDDDNSQTASSLFLFGVGSVATSGYLLVSSGVNRVRANSVSLNLKMEMGSPAMVSNMSPRYFPAFSVRIPIR